jgi:predicted amino acid-binding ACT domain protein
MALNVKRAEVWVATIEDRAGGAADKLEPLVRAGANFEFVFTRRTPENPGRGLLLAYPIKGAKVVRAAQEAGFTKPFDMFSVRIEGSDKPGVTAAVAHALAQAGLSFRGMSATGFGKKFVSFIALDSDADAATAVAVLKKLR